jgi:hypothetical protein
MNYRGPFQLFQTFHRFAPFQRFAARGVWNAWNLWNCLWLHVSAADYLMPNPWPFF